MEAAYLGFLRLLCVFFCTLSCHGAPGSYVAVPRIGRYILHEESKTYSGASRQCQEEGAHLAVINSKAEEDVLMNLFQRSNVTEAYVGVNDIAMEGFWVTIFDEPWSSVGFTQWGAGQPDLPKWKEDCGALDKKTRTLHDYGCNSFLSFFCEMNDNSNSSPSKGPVSAVTFSDEYVTVPGVGSYKFHVQQAAYSEAAEICEAEDSHLVVINSKQEEDVMINFLTGLLQSEAFVGINDIVNDTMVTVLGQSLDDGGYYRFQDGASKPGDVTKQCVVILNDRKMNTVQCGERHSFLCEKYLESFPKSARSGGYVTVPDLGSYILHDYPMPYKMAVQMCENEGAHLAILESRREEDFLMKLLAGSLWTKAFVRVTDVINDGDNEMTALGETWSKAERYSKRVHGEPDVAKSVEGCVAVGGDRLFEDVKCTLKMAYFCERAAPSVKSSAQAPAFSIFTFVFINVFLYLIKGIRQGSTL